MEVTKTKPTFHEFEIKIKIQSEEEARGVMQTEPILEFQGPHRWLSNFQPVTITGRSFVYQSAEHAYMASKSHDPDWKRLCSQGNRTSGQIKRMSRSITLRPDWDDIKLAVMEACLEQKFTQEPFALLLKATGNVLIQEGNCWGDAFWGVDLKTGRGENHLGKIIMEIRRRLILIDSILI